MEHPVGGGQDMLERAFSLRASLDFGELSRQHWKCVGNADRDFAIHKRSSTHTKRDEPTRHEVLCSGSIAASVEELAAVLHATTNKDFEAQMRALYDKDFIFGTIEKTVTTEGDQVLGGGGGGGDGDNVNPQPQPHVAVKTASFVAPDVFAKNEQWCFLELFLRDRSEGAVAGTSGFTLARSSLQPVERTKGKLPPVRVRQLHGLTTCYFVERLAVNDRRKGARVHFYGVVGNDRVVDDVDIDYRGKRVEARLNKLAESVADLPGLVRRRRIGVQVLADHAAFDVKNPRCTCCTRRFLPLVTKKTRCYLCGYYICEPCSARDRIETCNGHLATIIVCTRCMDGVNSCDYSNLGPSAFSAPRIVLDPPLPPLDEDSDKNDSADASLRGKSKHQSSLMSTDSSSAEQQSTTSSEADYERSQSSASRSSSTASLSPACQMLMEQLRNEIRSGGASSASRRQAIMTIIRYLLDSPTPSLVDPDESDEAELKALVSKALDVSGFPAEVEACELAGAKARAYPALIARSADKSDAPSYPIPGNEDQRLASIAKYGIDRIGSVPELDAICTLAAAETKCVHGVVTLIEKDHVQIMAANSHTNWNIGCHNVREQTFCQHFVMDERPLLVSNAEADVRFFAIDPVAKFNLRFYLGFPVRAPDGEIVGALCVIDSNPREITRSQYWRLVKLAEAASRVLREKCRPVASIP